AGHGPAAPPRASPHRSPPAPRETAAVPQVALQPTTPIAPPSAATAPSRPARPAIARSRPAFPELAHQPATIGTPAPPIWRVDRSPTARAAVPTPQSWPAWTATAVARRDAAPTTTMTAPPPAVTGTSAPERPAIPAPPAPPLAQMMVIPAPR